MTSKKMEGNEQQRRKKANEARRRGRLPSAEGATQGASRQRHHLPVDADHVKKLETIHQGKQPDAGIRVSHPQPRPGSRS
jgi:hypothetical protein